MHIPVLLKETIKGLNLEGKSIFIDGTLGLGGHSKEILKQYPNINLIGIDQDTNNIKLAKENLKEFGDRVRIVNDNFANIEKITEELGVKGEIDGILLDIGVASTHFDNGERGFAFQINGPLDMRMDSSTIKTAKAVVNSYQEQELFLIFKKYGEEPNSRKIAKAICDKRKKSKIETTEQLKDLITEVVPGKFLNGALKRIFQALRIEVNNELGVLEKGLTGSTNTLKKDGNLVVISYHSLEDRIVKTYFKEEEKECICPQILPTCQCEKIKRLEIITKKPIIPTEKEIDTNQRSRSAKLRIAKKTI